MLLEDIGPPLRLGILEGGPVYVMDLPDFGRAQDRIHLLGVLICLLSREGVVEGRDVRRLEV